MGTADEDPGTGGVRTEDVRGVIQGGSSGSVAFGVRDVGPEPLQGTDPEQFSAQGFAADNQEAAK